MGIIHSTRMESIYAYLPADRLQALACDESLPEAAMGSALFADISGFTPLFERLAAELGPQRAAEEMTRLVSQVYESLIGQVDLQRGSVIDFVGDAITCWFEGDVSCQRSAICALAMQQEMAAFANAEVIPGVTAALAVKVGIACGAARRFVVGNPDVQQLDTLAGETLRQMSQAEGLAKKGEIILSPSALARLQGSAVLAEHRTHPSTGQEFALLADLPTPSPPNPWPELEEDALDPAQIRPWVLKPIYARLRAGGGQFLPELRPVTALFLHFSGIDYDDDPEAGRKLDSFIRWAQETAAHFDGYLIQLTIGDKGSFVYIVFGAITAHEDDAIRAVHTAKALQALPQSLRFITIQIGIASGPARTGIYGSTTRRSYGAIGRSVVLAARLMAAAPPGEMRCSYSVYHQACTRKNFENLPPVRVKGWSNLVRVYRPVGGQHPSDMVERGKMVGRQTEIAIIEHLLVEVQGGAGRVLVIEGEAGIGKSRLVEQMAYSLEQRGLKKLMGAGQSIEQQTPYRAWRDVLAAYFGLEEGMALREQHACIEALVEKIAPEYSQHLPVLNDVLGLEIPENALTRSLDARLRQQNVTSLSIALLHAWALQHPLILILEDAHWLDESSWQLVADAVRLLAVARAPFLIVLAQRPLSEVDTGTHPSAGQRVLTKLNEMNIAQTLALTGLEANEVAALLTNRLSVPVEQLPAPLVSLVQEHANGNPFFAEELLFNLREAGFLAQQGASFTLAGNLETARQALPDTLHGLILARIDRLPPERQFVLKAAAVIGRNFAFAPLHHLLSQHTPLDAPAIQEHLAGLSTADFTFVEALEPDLAYSFKHIVTQEAAYQTLLFSQRRTLHSQMAAWYEAQPDRSRSLSLLVHHYHQAEDWEKERPAALQAGEEAARQYANTEALRFFSRALELTPEANLEARREVLLARVKIYHLLGERTAEIQDLDALDKIAAQQQKPLEQAQVALLRAQMAEAVSDYTVAVATAQAILALPQAAREPGLLAEAALTLGRARWRQQQYAAAHQSLADAAAWAQQAGKQRTQAEIVRLRGAIASETGDFDTARIHYQQSLQIYQTCAYLPGQALVLNNLGVADWWQGRYAQASAFYQQALALVRQVGDRLGESTFLNNLGTVQSDLGNYENAISYYQQSLHLRRLIENPLGESHTLINLGQVYVRLGQIETAQLATQQGLEIKDKIGDRDGQSYAYFVLGLCALYRRQYEDALRWFDANLDACSQAGIRWGESITLYYLGECYLAMGETAQAYQAMQAAVHLQEEIRHPTWLAETLAGLARSQLALEIPSEALTTIEKALHHLAGSADAQAYVSPSVYLTCYHVFVASGDERAQEHLIRAHDALQDRAIKISDPALRTSFLEGLPENQALVALYRQMVAKPQVSALRKP